MIKKLKRMVNAYRIALEYDYCTSEIPEFEGSRPDEIADRICVFIEKL